MGPEVTALFGPAYKGIPLVVAAASSLYRNYQRDLPYCFNRKGGKDHGEGGSMVGYKPQDGDVIAIVEDVVTAGTAVRESIELFKSVADVKMAYLFVSVDRMERGTKQCSTLDELRGGLRHPGLPHRHRPGDHLLPAQPPHRRQGVYRRRDEGPDGGLSGPVRRDSLTDLPSRSAMKALLLFLSGREGNTMSIHEGPPGPAEAALRRTR